MTAIIVEQRPAPIAAVAAHGLAGTAPISGRTFADPDFDALLDSVRDHRIPGLLVAAIESGRLPATEQQLARANGAHEAALAADLLLERALASASRLLADSAIEHRALKGPAVARLAYAEIALRSFGDIDLLIDATRFADAVAVLTAGDRRVRQAEPRPGFVARFGKGVCVVGADTLELDLHRTLAEGPFGQTLQPADVLRDPAVTIDLGDTQVPVPDRSWLFLHACYHVALGSFLPRWSSLRDIAELVRRPDLDIDRIVGVAQRWRGRAVIKTALEVTASNLPAPLEGPLIDWATAYQPDAFEQRALRVYRSADRSYGAQVAAGLFALRGVRNRAAYLRAMLLPSRSYLRAHDTSYWRRLRRGVALVRQSRRG